MISIGYYRRGGAVPDDRCPVFYDKEKHLIYVDSQDLYSTWHDVSDCEVYTPESYMVDDDWGGEAWLARCGDCFFYWPVGKNVAWQPKPVPTLKYIEQDPDYEDYYLQQAKSHHLWNAYFRGEITLDGFAYS